MALNIPNIEAPGIESDYSKALRSANSLQSEMLQRKMLELKNKYYGPKQEADIAHQNLINKYYGPNIESEMGLRNAQAGHYPYLNRLTSAQAAEKEVETPFIPIKYGIQQMNALIRQKEHSNSVNNSFRSWTQTPEGQQIVKNRPDIARAILQSMESQAGLTGGNAINNAPMQMGNQSQQPTQPTQMGQPAQGAAPSPEHQPAAQYATNNPLPQNATESQLIKDIQQGAADAYERTNLPADTKKRLMAGERFKSSVPSVLKNFKLASVYFSPKGQAKLKADEARALKDKRVTPELQAYRKFEQGLEQLKVQGAFLEGVPADQISRAAYAKVYDISKFFNNPTDAYDSLKYAINLARMADQANTTPLSEVRSGRNPNDQVIESLMNEGEQQSNQQSSANTKPKKTIKVVRDKNGNLVRSNS